MTTAAMVASQARRARDATTRRDELICQMRDEGSSLRTIAAAAGLSHTAVKKILVRFGDDHPSRCSHEFCAE